MSDRYDDYGRNSQGRRGEGRDYREGHERESGREEQDYRNQGRGSWREEQERSGGRGEWGRDRERSEEPYYGGSRGESGGSRGEYGGGSRGSYGSRGEYGSNWRGEYGGSQGEYGGRRDFSGHRGEYAQNDYGRSGERDWRPREPEWQSHRTEWGRERTGHEGLFGTGSQGFGTGYRSGEMSSSFSGGGSYTGFGSSGSESYSGGAGAYGQQRGRFSGKGPKGYQRSDERIREDVCERLTHHPEIDASEIDVKVNNGEVTLTGTVDERQAKRMSEDLVESISGVKDVHNQIRVREREMAGAGTHQQSGQSSGSAGSSTSGKEQTGNRR